MAFASFHVAIIVDACLNLRHELWSDKHILGAAAASAAQGERDDEYFEQRGDEVKKRATDRPAASFQRGAHGTQTHISP